MSSHFTLAELTRTVHPEVQEPPSLQVLASLETLSADFLEPIRAKFGPLYIHSAYRSPALNKLVGGVPTSAHCFGAAADFTAVDPQYDVTTICRWIRDESELNYDQCIDETAGGSRWVHLGIPYELHPVARRQTLVWTGSPPYTIMGK